MADTRKRRPTLSAGVSLELDVVEYLREVAARQERDRSYCINQIVREHAERHGRALPAPSQAEGSSPLTRSKEP